MSAAAGSQNQNNLNSSIPEIQLMQSHQMNTRHEGMYKVQHANTGRLKDSAIIYMQNMLNENERKKT